MKRIRFKHTWMRCLALFLSGYILGYGLFGIIGSCPESICFLYLILALIGAAFLVMIDV